MSKNKRNSRKSHVPAGAGIRPVKSLGQNFLIDEEVIGRIVEGSGISKDTLVIEIGPGTGALTLPLAEAAGHVTAIELDERVIPGLRVKTFSLGNVISYMRTSSKQTCRALFRKVLRNMV